MGKILDSIFGNKLVVVDAYKLSGHARWEQSFVFHQATPESDIKKTLKSKDYSATSIKIKRTKKHKSPDKNMFRPITKEKVVCFYD